MKKLILLLLFLPIFTLGQISCEEYMKKVKYKGVKIDNSVFVNSSLIYSAFYYKYDDMLFIVVKLNNYNGKEYIYGGLDYSYELVREIRDKWEDAESAGEFFHANIKPLTIYSLCY